MMLLAPAQRWKEIKCHFIYRAWLRPVLQKQQLRNLKSAVTRCGQQRRASVWNSGLSHSKHSSQRSEHTGLRSAMQASRGAHTASTPRDHCGTCVMNTLCSQFPREGRQQNCHFKTSYPRWCGDPSVIVHAKKCRGEWRVRLLTNMSCISTSASKFEYPVWSITAQNS